MFSNLNKSAFGTSASTPSFGFGDTSANNQTPFGQTQFFGKSNTAGFGQSAPLFGSTSQQNPGTLFSNTTAPSFGGTTQQTGFGTGLFGQQQNVGVSSGTNGLFSSTSTPTFGQQNKTPSFGFGTTTSSLFGQQQTQNFQPSTSSAVFGTTSGFGTSAQTGTVIKFNPATGTDTMQKSGVTHSINTKHHCITCMKEYEGKSLEELRSEDYQANRKGPQSGFGATSFGAPASTAASLFAQTDGQKAFGQNFGTPSASGFNLSNQSNQPSLFGKPNTGFGSTPTTNSFSFNSTPAFGSSNIGKTFGTQPSQSVFGSAATTQASTGFGSNLFPNTPQNTGLFGKSTTQSVFSNQQPSFTFNQPSTSQPSFFPSTKSTSGFSGFGSTNLTTTPSFGQTNNLFTSQTTQNPFNAMQKPAQPTFGQPLQTGFGLGTQSNTNNFFGGTKSLFGGTTQSNFFNAPSTGFMMNQQHQPSLNQSVGLDAQPNQDFQAHVDQIYDPFPHYEFLLDAIKPETQNTTDPKVLKEILNQSPLPITSIEKNISKYRTLIKPRTSSLSSPVSKYALLDDTMENTFSNSLSINTGKRLLLRRNTCRTDRDMMEEYNQMVGSGDGNKNKSLFRNIQQVNNEKCDVLEQARPVSVVPNSISFEETPIRNNIEKLKAKQILSNTQKDNGYVQLNGIIDRNFESLHVEAKNNKTVGFQDNKFNSSKEISIHGINPLNEINGRSENDDNIKLNENLNISSTLTCGVKLTNPDWYTKPALTELHKFENDKNECIVKGFTIGRTGYGSIHFPDAMDVANLNLDEIIQFHFREITVYPDNDKKPPVGQGLNRRAQVTLEHVWPRDRNTHEIIKDVNEIAKTNFIDRLRTLAERQNATFLNYHPETGSWVFTVNHFSKYVYIDSSDEECDKDDSKMILQSDKEAEFKRNGLGGIRMTKELDATVGYQIFADQQHMSCRNDENNPVYVIKSSFFDDESISDDESSCDVRIPIPFPYSSILPKLDQFHNKNSIIKVYPLLFKDSDSVKSFSHSFSDNYSDLACFKGRSFKVRWSRGYKLTAIDFVHNSTGTLSNKSGHSFISRIKVLDVTEEVVGITKIYWEDNVHAVFKLSSFTMEGSDLPTYSINSISKVLKKICEISKTYLEFNQNNVDLKYNNEVWNLCRILWGLSNESESKKRELFSLWLRRSMTEIAINPVVRHAQDLLILRLLKLFFANNITSASELAIHSNLPALSLLLSQKQESTKRYLEMQYEQWQRNGILDAMDEHVLRMYMLLGGGKVIKGSNVFHNLEWKQVLATYLCHICPKSTNIKEVVMEYTKAFTVDATANYPLIAHHKQISQPALDLQYRLLEFYSNLSVDLSKILNPYGYSKHAGDFHLSWMLMLVLNFNHTGIVGENLWNTICTGFAAQLEALGLWTSAILVLLFMKDEKLKKEAIISILERNIEFMTENAGRRNIDFLINKLKLPSEMIHFVFSYMKDVNQSHLESYQHSVLSKNWQKANQQALLFVIPELILNHKYSDLYSLFEDFPANKHSPNVHEILEFLQVHIDIATLKMESNTNEIKKTNMCVESKLTSLFKKIKQFPKHTVQQSLTITELLRHIQILFNGNFSKKPLSRIESNITNPADRFFEYCPANVLPGF